MKKRLLGAGVWIVLLALAAGCVGGAGRNAALVGQKEAETRFRLYEAANSQGGGTLVVENLLSAPALIKIVAPIEEDAWVVLEVPANGTKERSCGDVEVFLKVRIDWSDKPEYFSTGTFRISGEYKVELGVKNPYDLYIFGELDSFSLDAPEFNH